MKFKNVLIILLNILPVCIIAQDKASLNSTNILWKLKPQDEVGQNHKKIFTTSYSDKDWIDAVVPGTIFNSYVVSGLEKDPNFGDNIHKVDKSKYNRSFWYRTEFSIPESFTKDIIWLNLEGINREGDVYFNGKKIATLSGMMQRGKFDISKLVHRNEKNILAILVSIPKLPLNNNGSPTYISSAGWDWMPYVPGLNSGITDDVYLSNTNKVTIIDPWIHSNLISNARADIDVKVELKNSSNYSQEGVLRGVIMPGNITFLKKIHLEADGIARIKLNKNQFPELAIHNPKLWWPNGYGDPNLYTCKLTFKIGDVISDEQKVTFGIKKYTYDTEGGVLHVSINGKRVFLKGGNWGMSEYMLRCRGDEYDLKVRLHKEMNYNIIRNWLGSTTDDEFYQACDKYGIMVWDDFWLNANPNLPLDIHVFNKNVIEKIKRVRNHTSIAVWCGNNEGLPQPPLNGWIAENIKTFDNDDRYYQPCSNTGNLSGSGLWGNKDPRFYFTKYPTAYVGTGDGPGWGLRSEIGTAVFPNIESLKKFIPKQNWWPRNEMWNKHFFGEKAFNASPDNYDKSITERYGKPNNLNEYTTKAQLLNIETNKAMYEGWLDNMWEDASGIMIWMSQSSYPSMVWQTYDYYYDLTGAYWGVKSACEPMHIQWNPVNNSVKIINTTGTDYKNLNAVAEVYNMNGKLLSKFKQNATIDSYSNTATESFVIPFYSNQKDLAFQKNVVASSTDEGYTRDITDGNSNSRWASKPTDNEWIYVDLEKEYTVNRVILNWENAYGKEYKIQTSIDAQNWIDVHIVKKGKQGVESISFYETKGRYVRMLGLKRGSNWGYSLYDFKVFGTESNTSDLSPVHFIRLKLKNAHNKVISENFYWRGINMKDFTELNKLPKSKVKISNRAIKQNGKYVIKSKISSPSGIAFGIRIQAINDKTGNQILPAIISNSYFTLLKGESKEITIEFNETLLKDGEKPIIKATPYNN